MIGQEGDLQDGDAVSQAVIEGVASILVGADDDDLLDDGYSVLNNVQVTFSLLFLFFLFFVSHFDPNIQITLLCLLECGEEGVTVESGGVVVGAQSGTLEQLAGEPIMLGDSGAFFIFPSNLDELEEELGRDTCLYTGTSAIASQGSIAEDGEEQTLAASLTFYTINCTTGVAEEVSVTTRFLISSSPLFFPLHHFPFFLTSFPLSLFFSSVENFKLFCHIQGEWMMKTILVKTRFFFFPLPSHLPFILFLHLPFSLFRMMMNQK